MQKLGLVLEILKLLSRRGEHPITTTELFKELVSIGVLKDKASERKRLIRALSDLESLGYVESCLDSVRGKVPQRWKLNLKALPYFVSLSEKEVLSLLTLTAFVPSPYKEFSVIKPAFEVIERLGKTVPEEVKDRAKEFFDYLPIPTYRYSFIEENTLKLLFEGILYRRAVLASYCKKQVKLYPIKIFTYNGNFYLSAVEAESKEYRTYNLAKVKVLSLTKEEFPLFYWKRYRELFFPFDSEPFIFTVELPSDYYSCVLSPEKIRIYPTQFDFEIREDSAFIHLVGFTSYRFVSWIALDEVKSFCPPSTSLLKRAKELNLKEEFKGLSYSLKENEKRFKKFMKSLRSFISRRNASLSKNCSF